MDIPSGVILEGHFVIKMVTERHTNVWINETKLFLDPRFVLSCAKKIASHFMNMGEKYDLVIGIPDATLSLLVASHSEPSRSGIHKAVQIIPLEKGEGGELKINPSFQQQINGRRVLLVKAVTARFGCDFLQIAHLVEQLGGTVVGDGSIIDRDRGANDRVYFKKKNEFSIFPLGVKNWQEWECPLCRGKISIDQEFGLGKEFLVRKRIAK